MSDQPSQSTHGPLEVRPAEPAWRRGDVRMWAATICVVACYLLLGHDFGRSLLADDGFNVADVEMQERTEEGLMRNRVGFLGLAAVGGVLLWVVPGRIRLRIRHALPVFILLYLAMLLMSYTWSVEPGLTLRGLSTTACAVLGAVGVAYAFTCEDICVLALIFSTLSTGAGLLAELTLGTFKPWQAEYRFAGLVHPNTQAIELTLLILSGLTLAARYPRSRLILSSLITAATLLTLLTRSRTGVACLAVSAFSLWLLGSSRKGKTVTILAATLALGFVLAALLATGLDDPDSFANAMLMGRDDDTSTLTGRIPLWTVLWQDIQRRPLLGYGFSAFWDPETLAYLAEELEWAVPNAHNAYLESMLEVGLLGTLLLGATVVTAMIGLVRRREFDPCYALFFAIIVFGLLNGVFESYMIDMFNFIPFVACAGIFRLAFFDARWQPTVASSADRTHRSGAVDSEADTILAT